MQGLFAGDWPVIGWSNIGTGAGVGRLSEADICIIADFSSF